MRKKALITGVTGQDGAYLARFLLAKGYEVHGLIRRSSINKFDRIQDLIEDVHSAKNFFMHYGDVTDSINITRVIAQVKPCEIYNLAAQSHVKVSFESPEYTANADGLGALRILETIKNLGLSETCRFYQASTSELYGNTPIRPQNEQTPFYPRSPYGIAKLYAYWITQNYREAYKLFACNGVLFNHESPWRGETFVTRKITIAVSKILNGKQEKLYLGNIDSVRDWGFAGDYVEAMWKMLQLEKPVDLVIGTGEAHTVREFCEEAFAWGGVKLKWQGKGENEKGVDAATGKTLIEIDPYYFRPTEVDYLLADARKAQEILGWHSKVTFKELVKMMMESDMKLAKEGRI